jgi:hypothetical protein
MKIGTINARKTRPVINSAGQIAFSAPVDGTDLDWIWATTKDGELKLIARRGDIVEVGPGDSRTVLVAFVGQDGRNGDGRPTYFNDLGQLVFSVFFSDVSQGILVSNAVADIPNLLGDYNGNNCVDAADYVVWRNTFGHAGSDLAADGNGNNLIDSGDYDVWRANFGRTAVSNSVAEAAVPEPTSVLFLIAAFVLSGRVRPSASRSISSS